jgi:hypothetical protein
MRMISVTRAAAPTAPVILLLVLGAAAVAVAQSVPNLAGTWILDEAHSSPAPGGTGGRGAPAPNQLVITQTATELTVARGTQSFHYALDGSETPGPPGGETKSTVAWQGGALVVSWTREYFAGLQAGYVRATGRDIYQLNGMMLTVVRTSTTPRGVQPEATFVYTRSS